MSSHLGLPHHSPHPGEQNGILIVFEITRIIGCQLEVLALRLLGALTKLRFNIPNRYDIVFGSDNPDVQKNYWDVPEEYHDFLLELDTRGNGQNLDSQEALSV